MEAERNQEQPEELQRVVLTQVMRMNATINGIVVGIVVGTVIFIATLWLVIKGGEVVGPHLGLLDQFFWGYSVTFGGSFVGFVYGFLVGFTLGYFIAFTYNTMVTWRAWLQTRLGRGAQGVGLPDQAEMSRLAQSALSGSLDKVSPNGTDSASVSQQRQG